MNNSIVEGLTGVRVGGGGMEWGQIHWQVGHGDRERRGGEEGLGLGHREPEGETRGRADKETGETGREGKASWVAKDSLLGDLLEGEALPEVEERMGETGLVVGSDGLGAIEEGTGVRLLGVVAVSEGAVL